MIKPKKVLYFVLYWILLCGLLQEYITNSTLVQVVPDLAILYLTLTKIPDNVKEVRSFLGDKIVRIVAVLLLGGTLISFINAFPFLSILWGFRMVVRYFLLVLLILKYFDFSDVLKCESILHKLFWVNVVFVLYQFFVENKFSDDIGGIFENNGMLFAFNMYMMLLISYDFFDGKIRLRKFLFIIAIEMFIAMVAEIKMMYFTIPLVIYAVYVFTTKFSIRHIVVLAVAFVGLIPAMQSVLSLMYGEEYVNEVFDADYLQDETTHSYNLSEDARGLSFNRSSALEMTSTIILKDRLHNLVGYGIGSANASDRFGTWITQQYKLITSYNWFTTSWVLIEYGWIGFALWVFLYVLLAKWFYDCYKNYSDWEIKKWSAIGCLSVLFTFILSWYNNIPYYNAYLIYYLWAMCILAIRERFLSLEI